MNIRKIIANTALAGLVGTGIFGCSSEPAETKIGVIEKEWTRDGKYNVSVYLTSDTGRAWVMHDEKWMQPVLDSIFDVGDTVTIEKDGHYIDGLTYYHIVK